MTELSALDAAHAQGAVSAEGATAASMELLALLATRPGADDVDTRPMPDDAHGRDAIDHAMQTLFDLFAQTRMEEDAEDVLKRFVTLFHGLLHSVERKLDDNMVSQRRLMSEQDGSEVKDVELQQIQAEGVTLEEQESVFRALRAAAAAKFSRLTGSLWTPPSGVVARSPLSGAILDAKSFIAARNRRRAQEEAPEGPVVLFSGDPRYEDIDAIWSALDAIRAKHPQMVLAHTALKKGADLIAAKWAANRNVDQIRCEPDWKSGNRRAAPFKRFDDMIRLEPIGAVLAVAPDHDQRSAMAEVFARKCRQRSITIYEIGAS